MIGIGQFEKRNPEGFEQLTGLSSAKGLTVPKGARLAVISCATQAVTWRDDGTAPTASVGVYLPVNTPFVYTGNLNQLQFIEAVASAVVNISYYS